MDTPKQNVVSFDYLEEFIEKNYIDKTKPPDTDLLCKKFQNEISKFTNQELEYFLCHTGYISEFYAHDSCEETLQTKLSEAIVCEWAKRIDFIDSSLPTQKASKEDVFIANKNNIIVCDVKTYRLGRSQKAPNVKDALKLADIQKWKNHYKGDTREKIGGLVTFPVEHDWKNGSDFYLYTTDKESPTAVLFYFHLAFFIKKSIPSNKLINFLKSYLDLFPERLTRGNNNRENYLKIMENYIFNEHLSDLEEYKQYAFMIRKQYIKHTIDKIHSFLEKSKKNIDMKVSTYDFDTLVKKYSEVKYNFDNSPLLKQLKHIKKFRSS